MAIYKATKTFQSEVIAGVTVTLRKATMNRRAEIERLHEPILERLRAIQEEFGPLNREYADAWRVARQFNKTERDAAIAEGRSEDEALAAYPYGRVDFSPEKFQRWEDLRKAATRIDRDELTPVAVRACVVRINGLTLQWDDESGTGQSGPATVDGLLEYGPTELYDEILVHVQHELGLSAGEKENLSSPSTSGAVEGGKSPSGSAAPAGTPEMTTGGVAESSTAPASAVVPITG